jgi:hypothetical protein
MRVDKRRVCIKNFDKVSSNGCTAVSINLCYYYKVLNGELKSQIPDRLLEDHFLNYS